MARWRQELRTIRQRVAGCISVSVIGHVGLLALLFYTPHIQLDSGLPTGNGGETVLVDLESPGVGVPSEESPAASLSTEPGREQTQSEVLLADAGDANAVALPAKEIVTKEAKQPEPVREEPKVEEPQPLPAPVELPEKKIVKMAAMTIKKAPAKKAPKPKAAKPAEKVVAAPLPEATVEPKTIAEPQETVEAVPVHETGDTPVDTAATTEPVKEKPKTEEPAAEEAPAVVPLLSSKEPEAATEETTSSMTHPVESSTSSSEKTPETPREPRETIQPILSAPATATEEPKPEMPAEAAKAEETSAESVASAIPQTKSSAEGDAAGEGAREASPAKAGGPIAGPENGSGLGARNGDGTNKGSPNHGEHRGGYGVPSGVEIREGSLRSQLPGNRKPMYPIQDRRVRKEGTVVLVAKVLANGSIAQIFVEGNSGSKSMEQAAVQALRSWRYTPGKDEYLRIPMKFSLISEGM